LLLHLLSNIVDLPVTKSIVKDSGMGKAVGSIEKHRLVVGTPNESAIKERVQAVKDAWQASVKARKSKASSSGESKVGTKRPSDSAPVSASPSSAKRSKSGDDAKKPSSFSSLLKTLSGSDGSKAASNGTPDKAKQSSDSAGSSPKSSGNGAPENGTKAKTTKAKKATKRVKWSDHFGGTLTASQLIEDEEATEGAPVADVSWSDRKKRDRIREKELLAKAKCVSRKYLSANSRLSSHLLANAPMPLFFTLLGKPSCSMILKRRPKHRDHQCSRLWLGRHQLCCLNATLRKLS